ncbi:hypothetical protein C7T94_13865 [Pedobacter yulinensis]|uniref:Uncharacterized protein n=1 Tax=Pedobacter yulinensis TaxID=2126353 RepID=A0A2T3HMM4_9SPHI|nr:hypothetical protein [Pedobacter yulinensis]PST83621.1 hypothetical protein C7T94_13865 [Pedobacter yulinensis]
MLNLKNTLFVNAASSGATGILLIIFSNETARLFGLQAAGPFTATGIFLVAFAALVFAAAGKHTHAGLVQLVTMLDLLWVAASVLLVLFAGSSFSGLGIGAVLAVAGWVALMAFLQVRGLRSLQGAA